MRAAVRWVTKEYLSFGWAFLTALVLYITNVIFEAALNSVLPPDDPQWVLIGVFVIVSFLIESAILGAMLKISYGTACLVLLTMFATVIGIALVVTAFVFLFVAVSRAF